MYWVGTQAPWLCWAKWLNNARNAALNMIRLFSWADNSMKCHLIKCFCTCTAKKKNFQQREKITPEQKNVQIAIRDHFLVSNWCSQPFFYLSCNTKVKFLVGGIRWPIPMSSLKRCQDLKTRAIFEFKEKEDRRVNRFWFLGH